MKLQILIPNVKAVSINKAYYARNKVLTKEARDYREAFLKIINSSAANQNLMKAFKDAFDSKLHYLKINLTYLIPEDYFFTKAGEISMRSGDADNLVKLTGDFLMNEKYFDDPYRLEEGDCFNLGVDDRFVADYNIKKRPSEGYAIIVDASIHPLEELYQDVELPSSESNWNIVLK